MSIPSVLLSRLCTVSKWASISSKFLHTGEHQHQVVYNMLDGIVGYLLSRVNQRGKQWHEKFTLCWFAHACLQELYFWRSKRGRGAAFGAHCSREWRRKVHSHVAFECTATSAVQVCEGRIKVLEVKGMLVVLMFQNSSIIYTPKQCCLNYYFLSN